jgi:protein arginine kinase
MTEKTNLPLSFLEHSPWEKEINPIWITTSFILRRNLAKTLFPPKLDERGMEHTLLLLKEQLLNSPLLDHPSLLPAETLSATDKEYLFEHFLCMDGFQNTIKGQGFIVDGSSRFLAQINIQDHLQLQLIDCQGAWETSWNALNQLETAISTAIEFAFSPRFGYLTADPARAGTALTVYAFLHVPALIHTEQLQEALQKQKEEGITAMGMQGTLEDLVGDLLVLSNTYTLGVSEENILHAIHLMAMKLMALEKTVRSHMQSESNSKVKDQISRSYGLLLHSYQLQTKEALDALSLVKLGLQLNWIEGVSESKLNELFFKVRRAHLELALSTDIHAPEEAAHKRAEFLHKQLQGMQLKI